MPLRFTVVYACVGEFKTLKKGAEEEPPTVPVERAVENRGKLEN
jgi:hypothetical protein